MLEEVRSTENGLMVHTKASTNDPGLAIAADVVVLAIGVQPESSLAQTAGCELARGGTLWSMIRCAPRSRTFTPLATLFRCAMWSSGDPTAVPLAGLGNRQGRVAADVIAGRSGRSAHFRGTQATAVLGAFGLTAASTGLSAKQCAAKGIPHAIARLHPGDHVGYYPGATPIHPSCVLIRKPAKF